MRKILYLLLCFWLIFTLAACNSTRNELNSESASHSESAKSTLAPTARPSASPTESTPAPTTRPTAPPTQSASAESGDHDTENDGMISINIAVGTTTFLAKLYDNETAQALVAQFPMTIQMDELHEQEKYYYLSQNLPAESTQRPATIYNGDIMSWSGNCLVLFYRTYSNSNGGYVPLGMVDNPSNLASALGSGNVQVTWSLAD